MREFVISNFCSTDGLSGDDVAGIGSRVQDGLSGIRFLAGTTDFSSKRPSSPYQPSSSLYSMYHFPSFPGIKWLGLGGWGVKLSARHCLVLRLRIIMTVLEVPHLPAVTLVILLYISIFDFTSEAC